MKVLPRWESAREAYRVHSDEGHEYRRAKVKLKYTLIDAQDTTCSRPDGTRKRYYDIIRDSLTYEDLKRIFDNPRSDVYDLAINATHDFIARALVRYADDENFRRKAGKESLFLRRESLRLVRTNRFLAEVERARIVAAIVAAIAKR